MHWVKMVEVLYRHEHIIGKTSQKWKKKTKKKKKKKKKKWKTLLYINEQFYIWEDYKRHETETWNSW